MKKLSQYGGNVVEYFCCDKLDDSILTDLLEERKSKSLYDMDGLVISDYSQVYDISIECPKHTFLSVPCQLKLCGFKIKFIDKKWSGMYPLLPTRVIDCATRFTEKMYVGMDILQCLSFQYRKQLKIGRGGMVITDDEEAVRWLKMARINGRHEGVSQADEQLEFCGWNMYMQPCDAARGLSLMESIPRANPDCGSDKTYPNISNQKVFED